MREPRLARCHSAETVILPGGSWQPLLTSDPEAEAERKWDYPWPLGALLASPSKGTRNAKEALAFPSLHSDISGDSLAASKARKRQVSKAKAEAAPAAHSPRPAETRWVRSDLQTCSGAS